MRRIADRKKECALFERMLRGAEPSRILLLEGPSERGKSILLTELARTADTILRQGGCARADLKGKLPLDDLFSGWCADLGPKVFANYSKLPSVTTMAVNVNVDASSATFHDDNRFIVQPTIQVGSQNAVAQRGDAVISDLLAYASPLALIIDTFEAATEDASRWIIQKLLPTVRHNQRLCIVLAGQCVPDHQKFPLTWGNLTMRCVLPMVTSVDDWHEFARSRHPAFPKHHLVTMCDGGLTSRPSIILEMIENIVQHLPTDDSEDTL